MNKTELPKSDGDKFKAAYENYGVACPSCGKWNVFNRKSDIKSIGAACGKKVQCLHCKSIFVISTDDVKEQYEYLLDDCEELMKQNQYMYCILNLCQACEAFFMKCISIKLLWEPYRRGVFGWNDNKYRTFNEYYEDVLKRLRDFTYKPLLCIVFDLYLNKKSFDKKEEILNYLGQLQSIASSEPKNKEIKLKSKGQHQQILLALKKLDINEVRNSVVHKDGYRPIREEVEYYHQHISTLIENAIVELNMNNILRYCGISNVIESLMKKD